MPINNKMADNIYFKKDDLLEKQNLILQETDIIQENKDIINQYITYLNDNEHKENTLSKIMYYLRKTSSIIKKDLRTLNKTDLQLILSSIFNDKTITPATKTTNIKALKQFYRWFKKIDTRLQNTNSRLPEVLLTVLSDKNNPNIAKEQIEIIRKSEKDFISANEFYDFLFTEVKASYKLEQISSSEVITEQDCINLIEKGCRSIQEKAFISLLHETGARIGEFLNLKLKDIKFQNHLCEVYLDGKTGARIVFVSKSIPYLMQLLDNHLFKDDLDSFLWVCQDSCRKGQQLKHIGSLRLLNRVFDRANIKKKHNPHWFRHSRASILAPLVSESILKMMMGWTKDSSMLKHYGHLDVNDVRNATLKLRGLDNENEKPKPIKCGICQTFNEPERNKCFKCGHNLRVEDFLTEQETINCEIERRMKEMFETFMKNPAKLQEFEKFKQEHQKLKT